MKIFQKGDQIAKLSDLVGKFERGLETLQRRRGVVDDMLAKAKERRRAFIQENPGQEIPAEIRHAITTAEIDARSTAEEIEEYELQLCQQRAELVSAREQYAREEAAAALEATASGVDKAAADLAAAMKTAGRAIKALRAILPETSPFEISEYGGRPRNRGERDEATSREALAMIVAESLAREAPDLFDRINIEHARAEALFRFFDLQQEPGYHSDTAPEAPALDAAAAAKVLISDRLRTTAREIKAGRLPPELGLAAAE